MNTLMQSLGTFAAWVGWSSLQACLLIPLILIVQRVCGGHLAPRWRYALWGLLILRLVLPSGFHLIIRGTPD
jgi:beta-lactamase regulating signal transducer with metallopeptidase domain